MVARMTTSARALYPAAMSLRLRFVRAHDGRMLREGLVRGVYARFGEDELADFHHTSVGRLEVTAHDQGYRVKGNQGQLDVHTYAMLDFGDVHLHCTVLRAKRAGSAVRGACPRCDTPLRPAALGAAYRTIATERLECPLCEVQVLGLHSAESLGAASTGGASWVRVVTSLACPQCGDAMVPAALTLGTTRVGVEACPPCDKVLLEPEDRRALEVAAEQLEP